MNNEWRMATKTGDVNRVSELLDAGVDINSLDEHGQTALMNAAYCGDVALTQLLVQRGANLNHAAKYKLTALMLAVINNRPDIVRMLVDAGANTELKGNKGSFDRTPLEYAQEHGYTDVKYILCKRT